MARHDGMMYLLREEQNSPCEATLPPPKIKSDQAFKSNHQFTGRTWQKIPHTIKLESTKYRLWETLEDKLSNFFNK